MDAETETLIPTIGGGFDVAIPFDTTQITSKQNYSNPKAGDPCHPLARAAHAPCIALAGNTIGREPKNGGNGSGFDETGASDTLTKTDIHAVAFKIRGGCEGGGKGYLGSEESAFTLSTTHDQDVFTPQMQVRRLTPTECARLQGFPDDYLPQVLGYSDSAAYKALGNSMAVNVMQLIGQRIKMVNEIPQINGASS